MLLSNLELGARATYTTAFAAGVLLHVFLFRRGEWDVMASKIILAFSSAYVLSVIGISLHNHAANFDKLWAEIISLSGIFVTLLIGLYASMTLYRSFFHPLRRFPGPFAARISGAYATMLVFRKFQYFKEAKKLHKTYGEYVRVGPNELSIAHPSAVQAIHANSSKCSKGPWYNTQLPSRSVHTTRDHADHARRRKVWDQGFSSKALRDYEPRVQSYTDQMLSQIEAKRHGPIDVSKQFNLYSFDVMGNLAFGKDFGLIKSQKMHPSMSLLQSTTALSGLLAHISWFMLLGRNIPGLTRQLKKFENDPDTPDVFSWVLAEYQSLPSPKVQDFLNLRGDAMLIVVAGSDTTAASLTCLFMELTRHPDKYRKLQEEVDKYFSERERPEHTSLAKLSYLQACIDESMRLHPPVPSGVQRQTPPEGIWIDNTWIPGNALVKIPLHTLYRSHRVFVRPDEFIPERWTSKPELVKDKTVFAPFSIGRYSCVGKQLGLMEIRNVTTRLLHRYDISAAEGQTYEDFMDNVVDGFTLSCPKLELVFTERSLAEQD